MKIKTPVIGIPQYWWHKEAIKYSRKNPNLIEMDNINLSYECSRHEELLGVFDKGLPIYTQLEYFKYYKGKKSSDIINAKIERYKKLYEKIKKEGYLPIEDSSSIIITDDGCRLDGSHRLAILSHLGYSKIMVNVFSYEKVFSPRECKKIRKENEEYRKNAYPDIDG